MYKIQLLTVLFDLELQAFKLSSFRSAILAMADPALTLFHNHNGDALRYKYPLIQYKTIHRKASLVCINDGIDEVQAFFSNGSHLINIDGMVFPLITNSVKVNYFNLKTWQKSFQYSIKNWLPYNQKNYKTVTDSAEEEKTAHLEKILIGNILSAAKGLSINIENTIELTIHRVGTQKSVLYKGVKMISLDAEFSCNVSLPQYIGLGKGVSLGFGTLYTMNDD